MMRLTSLDLSLTLCGTTSNIVLTIHLSGHQKPCAKKQEIVSKANLQIALLRKTGIPAGYGVYLVRKEILKPILPPDIYQMVNQPTVHVFTKLFIQNRWVSLDATVDLEMFQCFYSSSGTWTHNCWNRQSDISLDKGFVVEDQGVYANIDLYLSQVPKFWTDQLIQKANCFIEESIKNMREGKNGKNH